MLSTISSISSLLLSFGILSLSHGLQNTLLNIRGSLENYDTITIGLMNSFYFIGFVIGTKFTNKYIINVGQIRTFAALVSILSAISLLHIMFINPTLWVILRLFYGICISGSYMVIESWLNLLSNKNNRGRILSIYMIVHFLGILLGQTFINSEAVQGFILFGAVSIFASLSLVPLVLSKAKQPIEVFTVPLSIKKLYNISPLSVIGSFIYGAGASAFWSFGAIYILKSGFTIHESALFIASTFIGALVLQWPIGLFSDIFNRRIAIILCSSVSLSISILILSTTYKLNEQFDNILLILGFIFGGFSYPLYSLFISLANDFLKPGMFVKASATLLAISGTGSIFGPIIAAIFMHSFTESGLFFFMMLVYSSILITASYRLSNGRDIPKNTTQDFVSVPKTATSIYHLDPRSEED